MNESAFRLLTSPLRMLPSFIIPGETKCGTTTFYRCVTEHPAVVASDIKEPNNFIRYGGTSIFCKMHYPFLGKRWLHGGGLIAGEASVEYLSKKEVPAAIHTLLPQVKLIILLRNPILRAISDYKMMKDAGREEEDFDTVVPKLVGWLENDSLGRLVSVARAMDAPPLRYLTKGCYVESIKPWMEQFPKENILFIRSETFFKEPQTQLDHAFAHLNLPPYRIGEIPHLRKARITLSMNKKTIELLAAFFQPFNTRLCQLLGEEFSWEQETRELLDSMG